MPSTFRVNEVVVPAAVSSNSAPTKASSSADKGSTVLNVVLEKVVEVDVVELDVVS